MGRQNAVILGLIVPQIHLTDLVTVVQIIRHLVALHVVLHHLSVKFQITVTECVYRLMLAHVQINREWFDVVVKAVAAPQMSYV